MYKLNPITWHADSSILKQITILAAAARRRFVITHTTEKKYNKSVTFHGIYSFPRDSLIVNISMHFWATLDMTCSGSQGDPVSPVRWGAGRALYEERLLSRSLCGDFS